MLFQELRGFQVRKDIASPWMTISLEPYTDSDDRMPSTIGRFLGLNDAWESNSEMSDFLSEDYGGHNIWRLPRRFEFRRVTIVSPQQLVAFYSDGYQLCSREHVVAAIALNVGEAATA